MTEFLCEVRIEGAVTVVEVRGDIDMSVSGRLHETLEQLMVPGANVVLDASQIAFFDSMGLRVAVQAVYQAKEAGASFAVVPSGPVSRVLELAGVGEIFTIYKDLAEAAL